MTFFDKINGQIVSFKYQKSQMYIFFVSVKLYRSSKNMLKMPTGLHPWGKLKEIALKLRK